MTSRARKSVSDAANKFANKAKDVAHDVSSKAQDVTEGVSHEIREFGVTTTEAGSAFVENTSRAAKQASRSLNQQLKSAFDAAVGPANSTRRYVSTFILTFVAATAVRMLCFSPSLPGGITIFGKHLRDNLAPVEREDVHWRWIALVRAVDLSVLLWAWEATGRIVEGQFLGMLLCLISRPPLYLVIHRYFLLSNETLAIILLTDIFSLLTASTVMSFLLPRSKPTFRPTRRSTPWKFFTRLVYPRTLGDQSDALFWILSILAGATFGGLFTYAVERSGLLPEIMKRSVLDTTVPSYLSPSQPPFSEAIKHPTLLIPTLRSLNTVPPPSMPAELVFSLASPILISILSLFVLPPSYSFLAVPLVVLGLSFFQHFLTLWNVLPLDLKGSLSVATIISVREAVVATIVAWVLEDVRRPVLQPAGPRDAVKRSSDPLVEVRRVS